MPAARSVLCRDPALPWVEARRACHSRACYKAHSHPTFSIGAVDAGSSCFTGAGEGEERLSPGTLVLVPAQRVHACNPQPGQAWSFTSTLPGWRRCAWSQVWQPRSPAPQHG